jgi:flavin reductase (NADH)
MSGLERRVFLDIMGTLPSGVAVVTTLDRDGKPQGLTVSAVCSVSAEPPMLLISIDQRSRTLPCLLASGRFAVNFLRGDRAEVSRRFSSPALDRFDGIEWQAGGTGVPILFADSLSFAECRTVQEVEAGDHVILIAAVEGGSPPPPESRPLTYFRRRYSPWPGRVDAAEIDPAGTRAVDVPTPAAAAAASALALQCRGPLASRSPGGPIPDRQPGSTPGRSR